MGGPLKCLSVYPLSPLQHLLLICYRANLSFGPGKSAKPCAWPGKPGIGVSVPPKVTNAGVRLGRMG